MTITLRQAAKVLGIGETVAYRLAREGSFPGLRTLPGVGRYLVYEPELRAWLEGRDLASATA